MQGPPAHAAYQPPGQPVSHEPMHGTDRPYGIVLLLYIVTLGIYGLYWHYKTHDELCKQVGRENKDKTIWFVYIGVYVVATVVAIIFVVMFFVAIFSAAAAEETPSDEEVTEMMVALLTGTIGLLIALVIAGIAAIVLFVIYVLRQFKLLEEAAARMGGKLRLGVGGFMGLYFGATAISWLLGWIIPILPGLAAIAMQIIAYYLFQENYNDVWRTVRHGRHVPTDAEWAAGGARPAMPPAGAWDAPQMGAGTPAGQSPMGNPTPGTPASGTQPPGTTAAGFGISQRSPGAPTGRVVRQSFECPRCHTHIHASGAPGAPVDIRCTNCGEGGRVTLPSA